MLYVQLNNFYHDTLPVETRSDLHDTHAVIIIVVHPYSNYVSEECYVLVSLLVFRLFLTYSLSSFFL